MGSGYRSFSTNEVLTSSNVQNYLMDQSVMKFADAAARTAAVTAPVEGMVSYTANNDQIFVYNGSAWKAIAGSSSQILQVVNWSGGGYSATSSASFVDTYISASITPTSTSSKVLIFVEVSGCAKSAGNTESGLYLQLLRNSSAIAVLSYGAGYTGTYLAQNMGTAGAGFYLDNPGSTSPVTYKVQFKNGVAAAEVAIGSGGSISSLVLMEIAQ